MPQPDPSPIPRWPAHRWVLSVGLAALVLPFGTGCAVHYYDANRQVDHVWGFAHVMVRHSGTNQLAATQTAVETAGLAASLGRSGSGLSFGYNLSAWTEVRPDASLILNWRSGSLLSWELFTNSPTLSVSQPGQPNPNPTHDSP